MKKLSTKFAALLVIVALSTGCASSITAPQQVDAQQDLTEQKAPTSGDIDAGTEMQENRKRPETNGGYRY